MWLASPPSSNPFFHAQPEEILDRLLGLSPFVARGPHGELFAHLGGLVRYWKLDALRSSSEGLSSENFAALPAETQTFLQELRTLEKRYGLSFKIAPTAPWAAWLCAHAPAGDGKFVYSRDDFEAIFARAPLATTEALLPDWLSKSEGRARFIDFTERACELGLRSGSDLQSILRRPDARDGFLARFGGVFEKLSRRVQGADDFRLQTYEPPAELEQTLHIARETGTSENPWDAVRHVLETWETRLRGRRALLKGLEVSFRGERRRQTLVFRLPLPKATRDASSLMKLVEEKWRALRDPSANAETGEAFTDELDLIRLRSMGLDRESERQLDLFRPGREENLEGWNLLVARLLSRASLRRPVRVGSWRPFESWLVEKSVEWVDWGEAESLPIVRDPPARPLIAFHQPQPLAKIFAAKHPLRTEGDFLDWLEAQGALGTLERVREAQDERSYARVPSGDGRDAWVFWDHAQRAALVQGFFEERTRPE